MRIGIFGGTFDPPHNGHLALARACLSQLELDEVMFIPANRNPLKSRFTASPASQRLDMVRRMIDGVDGMAVSDMELTRGGPSYTIDTLDELHMVQPAEYWLLMGSDALKGLAEWKSPNRILKQCRIGVVIRPPETAQDALGRLTPDTRTRVDVVEMPPIDISSTNLRDRIARKLSIAPFVPTNVLKYIEKEKLYQL